MDMFEEQFKTKAQGNPTDLSKVKRPSKKAPSKTSLIDGNKAKNLAITLRKAGISPSAICTAIKTYVHHGKSASRSMIPSHSLTDETFFPPQVRPGGFVPRLPGTPRALHPIRL